MTSLGLWTWIAWGVLILAPLATGALFWHYGLLEGEHRGRCAEKERQLERERRAALRTLGPPPEIRAKTGRLPTGRSNYTPGDFRPQPAPDPEPRTRGLPALTNTGEIRALTGMTDAWLDGMRQKGLIT